MPLPGRGWWWIVVPRVPEGGAPGRGGDGGTPTRPSRPQQMACNDGRGEGRRSRGRPHTLLRIAGGEAIAALRVREKAGLTCNRKRTEKKKDRTTCNRKRTEFTVREKDGSSFDAAAGCCVSSTIQDLCHVHSGTLRMRVQGQTRSIINYI